MKEILTVTELNSYIANLLDSDPFLGQLWLRGEISGFRLYQQSGHMYFTLKDEDSTISAVMFKSRARGLKFKPKDGMEVLLRASVSVFARQGKYQLYVEEMQPYGIGGLFLYLEELKKKLTAKGYFAPERKKAIPAFVQRVGIVTSQDGAALRDICRILKQRHPGVEVVLAHSSVQGSEAPGELAEGLRLLNSYGEVELIIIGRGGGSYEDLMAFNSELVVQAIYESNIPVISAVGHEVDFTLADLVADLRAATPSQAASLAVADMQALSRQLDNYQQRLLRAMQRKLLYYTEIIDRLMMKRIWKQPRSLLHMREELLSQLEKRLSRGMAEIFREKEVQLSMNVAALDSLSPLKIMERGYVLLQKEGRIIRDEQQVQIGDRLEVAMRHADLEMEVIKKERVKRWKS